MAGGKLQKAGIGNAGHHRKGNEYQQSFLERGSRSGLFSLSGGRSGRGEVGNQEKSQHRYEDHRGQGIHGGLDASAHLTVNQGRQSIDASASGKVGDDEIVQRHGKGHEKTGQYTGKDVGVSQTKGY